MAAAYSKTESSPGEAKLPESLPELLPELLTDPELTSPAVAVVPLGDGRVREGEGEARPGAEGVSRVGVVGLRPAEAVEVAVEVAVEGTRPSTRDRPATSTADITPSRNSVLQGDGGGVGMRLGFSESMKA